MTKVSIIIPVYNVEQYLKECLDSVKNQTLDDIEIICTDDGSNDNSLNILNEYKNNDSRFIILTQQNKGAAAARTHAMKIAKGEYIGFVDADDKIDLNYYETLYNKAVKENADIVRTTFKYVYNDRVKDGELNKVIERKSLNNQFLNKNDHSVVIWNAIYKTEFLRKNKIDYFDEDLPMCHDVPFCARTDLSAETIVPAAGVYYYYRKGRYGQLITPGLKRLKCTLKATQLTSKIINSANIDEKTYKTAYKRCIWRLDSAFQKGLSISDFTEPEQTKYLDTFVSILKDYKYKDYPSSVFCLLKNDRKTYLETKTNKFKKFMLKTKKFIFVENVNGYVILSVGGAKIQLGRGFTPPPEAENPCVTTVFTVLYPDIRLAESVLDSIDIFCARFSAFFFRLLVCVREKYE